MDIVSLILIIIGAINWGSIGIFGFDIVGSIFGGQPLGYHFSVQR